MRFLLFHFFNHVILFIYFFIDYGSASKRIMGATGVPLVPGYQGDDQDIERMKSEADKIGVGFSSFLYFLVNHRNTLLVECLLIEL